MAKNNKNKVEGEGEVTQEELAPVEAPKVEIIRGRMPVAVVAMIRFQDKELSTAAVAAKYRTTVGKVDDIRKNRNFGYVTEAYKPSAADVTAAKAYLEQLTGENATNALNALEAMGLADDDGAAFEAARKAARKSAPKETPAAPADVAGEPTPEDAGEADKVADADLQELTD